MALSDIKALAFDVFGTVVDYRGTIMREGQQLNLAKGLSVDWAQFADAWRARYRPSMDRVMRGELPWTNLDALHRLSLNELLTEFKLNDHFTQEEQDHLNRVWHRLQPWPDVIPGLTHLRKRFVLATLSNGNMALLVNMAKYSALPWDCILSAELVQAYKPDPRPYQMAVKLLGLQSHEVMMVAAHQEDLRAAQAQGMQAAFVPRPQEYGPHNLPDLTPDPAFEVLATDFMDLAQQLGALDGAGRRWHIAKSARWRVRLNARQKTPRPVVFCSVEGGLLLIHFSIIPLHRLSAALDKILEHAK